MEKNNKTNGKSTWITAGFAFLFVLSVICIIFLFFQHLKRTDGEFAQTAKPDQVILAAEDETLPMPGENEKNAAGTDTPSYDDHYQNDLLQRGDAADVEEFTLDNHVFYYVNTHMDSSSTQPENFPDAKEAAQTALTTFRHYYPDRSWDSPFYIELRPAETSSVPEESADFLWYIFTMEENAAKRPSAMVMLHPLTGDILAISCPHTDPVYNGFSTEGRDVPFLSLSDFLVLSRETTWLSAGTKQIRALDINQGESFIHYEQDIGISFTLNGTVVIPYTIGNGEDARKIDLSLDLYTKDFVGYSIRTE